MNLEPEAQVAGAAFLIAWGMLDCFFGYRVFKFTVGLLGVVAGAIFGHQLFVEVLGLTGEIRWVGFGLGALLGGALAFGLYLVGVFILGFSLGFMLAPGLWPQGDEMTLLAVGAGAGLVCGLIAMLAQKLLVAVGTALSGAIRVVLGASFFIEGLDWTFYASQPQQIGVLLSERMWMLVVFVILGAAGLIAQIAGGRSSGKKDSKE